MCIVPSNLHDRISYRSNVERNVLSLPSRLKKRLWREVRKLCKTSIFHVEKRLNQSLRVKTANGIEVYGLIVVPGLIALIKISTRILKIYSVIDVKRLMSSTKAIGCKLLDECTQFGGTSTRVLVAAVEPKQILWSFTIKQTFSNVVVKSGCDIIVPFDQE